MKKKFKILFKNFFKYTLVISSIIILLKYAFDIQIVAKINLLNSKRVENQSINLNVNLNLVQFDSIPSKTRQKTLPKQSRTPILIDNLNFFLSNNQFSNLNSKNTSSLTLCSYIPPDLVGTLKIDENVISHDELEFKYSSQFKSESGGHWKPKNCIPQSKVAIIVPFRDRDMHLRLFLNHMHSFLQKQLIEYSIYIIEEVALIPFNRAMLMNIGYNEAIKDNDWDCFVFHDVDLVPEDDRNLYHCPYYPRHMSSNVNTFKYVLPYKEILGGVTAISREHFEKVNGFSNSYFGWGGEDDDFAERVLYHDLKIIRYPDYISRYFMLAHKKDVPSKQRFTLLESAKRRFLTDGLNSLNYKIMKKVYKSLFTWVLVSFDYPNDENTE